MLLQLITLLPFAVLILVPVVQRLGMGQSAWQGMLSQVSVWGMMPLALIWGVVCLDAGNSLQAAACLLAGLTVLLVGQSGGWETLISGRLTQFALGGAAFVLLVGVTGLRELLLVVALGILAFLYDGLLDLVGPAPEYQDGEEWELPRGGVSELGDPVVPRPADILQSIKGESGVSAQVDADAKEQPGDKDRPSLKRPPLPGLGQVMEWTADQAQQAARDSQQNQRQQQQPRTPF